jgi:acetoacetyl-CoA reductase
LTGLKTIFEKHGHVDVRINNAGITRDSQFKNMKFEQWYDTVNTNLNSLFNMPPIFKAMYEQSFGQIINISSINGLKGQFGQANYSATKAGVIRFTKARL